MTRTCTIQSDGSRYYISFGVTRNRNSYATPVNAKRAAEAKGYQVEGGLPNPKAKSVAHMVTVYSDRFTAREGVVVTLVEHNVVLTGTVENMNLVLAKLGYKPVRLTKNILNDTCPWLVIDADTPSYMDVGSEAYHSM